MAPTMIRMRAPTTLGRVCFWLCLILAAGRALAQEVPTPEASTPATLLATPEKAAAPVEAGTPTRITGTGFVAETRDGVLVSWLHADPPAGAKPASMLDGEIKLVPEGGREALIKQGVRFGSFPPERASAPAWAGKLEITTEWKSSAKPHSLELLVRMKNLTGERLAMGDEAPVVWMGPFADRPADRVHPATFHAGVKDLAGRFSVVDLSPPAEVSESARWLACQSYRTVHALELLEGPGRFLLLQVPAELLEAPGSRISSHVLVYRPTREIHGHETLVVRMRVFVGDKIEKVLKDAGFPELFQVWGGFFGWIGFLMFNMLHLLFGVTKSWGASILLLTLLVKVMLYPLNKKQLESMAKMQELGPKMQALQTRYADNPDRLNHEIQKMWREAGVNPLSGCLPMIMQIPIFFALYNCLSYAPELRGQPFLWLADLSLPDTHQILPLLFCAGIYLSSASTATDPGQRMMMQIMPIFLFFMMQSVASGVMLYLAGQTVLGAVEQKLTQDLRAKLKKPAEAGTAEPAPPAERVIEAADAEAARAKAQESSPGGKKKKGR